MEEGTLLVVVLTFLAVMLGVLGLYSLFTDLGNQRRPVLRQWVDQELRKRQRERARQSLLLLKHQALVNLPGAPVVATPWFGARLYSRLEDHIEQAGLFLAPWQVLAVAGGLAVFGGAMGAWLAPEAAVPVALAGLIGPFLWLLARRRARKARMMQQLPRAFELIARVIRAGQSVPQALQAVVDEFDPPLATEFAYCQEQQRLGLLPEISFREMSKRSEVMELKIFVMAMLVQQKTGGNLSDLLDRLAGLVRERVRLQGVIRTLTAEGRLQAQVLIALPPLMFLLLLVMQRSYVAVLLEHYELLIGAAVSMVLGALWIFRIVRLDY
jgi:tight adherence protein B